MKNKHTYIKIGEQIDEEINPTDDELLLDNYSEEEYNTPYTCYDDSIHVDVDDYTGSIFDDR